jgi:hypothetical protein
MLADPPFPCSTAVVIATMHAKERAIAPVLARSLGLQAMPAPGLDTDRFGTFSREIERVGSQLDAARAKIAAAFGVVPRARIGVASEGSFGPHPTVPFLPLGRELVLLVDRETGLEVAGHDVSSKTNFAHQLCTRADQALAFASHCRFPTHGVIVIGSTGERPDPKRALMKDIASQAALAEAVHSVIAECGAAFVETDMRAHRNPTRMLAIRRATKELVRSFWRRCPQCGQPGFDVSERVLGLPCGRCGEPTRLPRSEISRCRSCGHHQERPVVAAFADPGQCEGCNP